MIRGGRAACRLIFRTYDGLSNLKPVALHNSPAHARVCVPKTLSDEVLTVFGESRKSRSRRVVVPKPYLIWAQMSVLIVPQRGVAATLFSYVGARPLVLQSYTHFAE